MHQDTRRIRQRYAAINLDEYEAKVIDALVDYTGISKATLLRQLVLKEALETLGVSDIITPNVAQRAQ
ncbi:hypothetical protein HCU01_33620 [Halomonas cupida]|uniref:Uncharacterized protein n=1 Tax=Halomonas cupida TaxID=44933 RepID=A0A1M7KG47_9GAMM|nr:hypothetical protein [Halomonas cupida]GEN25413.1 hypothetical protein HCU01_33620 [Halomonas cupida]SHM64259.1 hypothetical protein SAMN05660971_03491 [Halomonas cupida]